MYVNYFGFREKPFNVTPDPRFVYMNPAYREAYASLLAGIRERKGFIVLTGEVGTGKTTLLRMLMRNLEATVRFVYFYNTTLSFEELLTFACEELSLEVGAGGRLKKIQALNDFLIDQLRKGGTGALLIDEAQHLSEHVLENLRLLSNLETGTEKLLQIVLVGQPELEAKLAQPSLRQLKQRVSTLCRIDRLKDREIQPYVQFRLESVGYTGKDIFDRSAIQRLTQYSTGIPRLINIMCDNALTIAYATTRKTIDADIIEEVAGDLGLTAAAPVVAPEPEPAPRPVVSVPAPAPARREPVAVAPEPEPPAAEERVVPFRRQRESRERRSLRPIGIAAAGLAAVVVVGTGLVVAGPRLMEMGGTVASAAAAAGKAAVGSVTWAVDSVSAQVSSLSSRPAANGTAATAPATEPRPAEIAPRRAETPPAAASAPSLPPRAMTSEPSVAVPATTTPERTPAAPPERPRQAAATPERAATSVPASERTLATAAPTRPTITPAPPARDMAAPLPSATPRTEPRAVAAAQPADADRRPVVIPQGGTISDIAFRTYGHYSTLAVDLIKESNPHISDLDWVRTGDRLWLPPLTRETLIRSTPDGSYRLVLASFLSPVAAEKLGDTIRRRGFDARVTQRQVTSQLALYRVEITGVGSRDAAEGAWRTAVANCWVFIADAPCERTSQ